MAVPQAESNPAGSKQGGAARPGQGNGLKAEKGKESPSKELPENKKVSGSLLLGWASSPPANPTLGE